MSQYQISKERLVQIIKEEYNSILEDKKELTAKQKEEMDVHPEPDGDGKITKDDLNAKRKESKNENLDSIRHMIKKELQSLE
jgi:hypothetical protein